MISDQAELVALRETVARLTQELTEARSEVKAGAHLHARATDRINDLEAERDATRNAQEAAEAEHRDCGMAIESERMQRRAAEAERDALRKRIEEGDVMWELHNELYDSLDAIDIRLRDDAERVRVLAEPDPEVTP